MAYFPNGESGYMWEEEWCDKCLRNDENSGGEYNSCPIIVAHTLYNYDQIGDEKLRTILSCLIDDDEIDGVKYAGTCKMFTPLPKNKLSAQERIESALDVDRIMRFLDALEAEYEGSSRY